MGPQATTPLACPIIGHVQTHSRGASKRGSAGTPRQASRIVKGRDAPCLLVQRASNHSYVRHPPIPQGLNRDVQKEHKQNDRSDSQPCDIYSVGMAMNGDLSTYLSVHLAFYLSTYLRVMYLSIYLSIYLSKLIRSNLTWSLTYLNPTESSEETQYIYRYVHIHTYLYTYIHMHMYTRMYVCMYVCMHVCMCVYVCM